MFSMNLGKAALFAVAMAGFALTYGQTPSNAAAPSYCAIHARNIASHEVPPGVAGYSHRFRRAYDTAYADCTRTRKMGSLAVVHHAMAAAPAPKADSKCQNFDTYSSSYTPTPGVTC